MSFTQPPAYRPEFATDETRRPAVLEDGTLTFDYVAELLQPVGRKRTKLTVMGVEQKMSDFREPTEVQPLRLTINMVTYRYALHIWSDCVLVQVCTKKDNAVRGIVWCTHPQELHATLAAVLTDTEHTKLLAERAPTPLTQAGWSLPERGRYLGNTELPGDRIEHTREYARRHYYDW